MAEESVSELRLVVHETKELLETRRHGGSGGNTERIMSMNPASSLHHNDTDDYTLSADLTNPFDGARRFSKSRYLKSIDSLISAIDRMQSEINSIKSLVNGSPGQQTEGESSARAALSVSGEEESEGRPAKYKDANSGGSEEEDEPQGANIESSLTMSVWPHPKLFLHIVRKMFRQGLITKEEKSRLKVYILSGHSGLKEILGQYEKDGETQTLFAQIRELLE